uniref:Uncharacterized protein n=1 Tax=Peronospora matthiolae TaxID=2874970 RepID=A0AAV1UX59_9STRA
MASKTTRVVRAIREKVKSSVSEPGRLDPKMK